MTARIWKVSTLQGRSDDYLAYMPRTGVKDLKASKGNRGIYVLRRKMGDQVEFMFISLWENLESVRGFAGPDFEKAVYYPEDKKYLLEMRPNVEHYEVVVSPDPRTPA